MSDKRTNAPAEGAALTETLDEILARRAEHVAAADAALYAPPADPPVAIADPADDDGDWMTTPPTTTPG